MTKNIEISVMPLLFDPSGYSTATFKVERYQPRSQSSLLPALRSERARVTFMVTALVLRRAGRREPWERGWSVTALII